MTRAAVLWTGGKDSFQALCSAREHLEVSRLVTFTADPPERFLAHPAECMAAQAEALGITHQCVPLSTPLEQAYERAIDELVAEGIEVLVTGDMDRVDGHESWIEARAQGRCGVERPLWGVDRIAFLRSLVEGGTRALITLARRGTPAEALVGRELDQGLVDLLAEHHGQNGFDACGENGEYHTCVLEGPGFRFGLTLSGVRTVTTGNYSHVQFDEVGRAYP